MSELDNLLDTTLDDIEDLPSFTPFPAGAHRVLASFEQKEINSHPAIELNLKMVEVVELAEPTATPPVPGDTANTMFLLDNEFGLGNFKKCATPFGEALGFSTMREIVEGVKEVECIVMTSVRKDKNDPDKLYLNVKEIAVV